MAKRLGSAAGPLIGLAAICVMLTFMTDTFLTFANVSNVVRQVSVNAILASGATLVILTGGIDLSVGSALALAGAVAAWGLMKYGIVAGVAAGLLVGVGIGMMNGVIISYGRVPPFIVTMGAMTIMRSLTLVFTDGRPISGFPEKFLLLGEAEPLGIPVPVIVAAVALLGCHILLRRTRFGRYIFAMGGNEDATRLSGINVRLQKTMVYLLAGLLTAVGALVYIARLDSAQPQAGVGYELDAIAAVVIGGTSLSGGQGGVGGTLLGALIMGVLRNGLNLMNVSAFWQQAFVGVVIIVAVLFDRMRRKESR